MMKRIWYSFVALSLLTTSVSADLQTALEQLTQELINLRNALQKSTGPSTAQQPHSEETQRATKSFATHGLLIFLDDSEKDKVRALSNMLLEALNSEPGPIIASASLLANVSRTVTLPEIDPKNLLKLYKNLLDKINMSEQDTKMEGAIALSAAGFTDASAKKWILKEINGSLFLLLPKKYIHQLVIQEQDIEAFTQQGSITATELRLGLKVNHMKTITFAEVKTSSQEYRFADYFINDMSNIFVTKDEYRKSGAPIIPAWAIYIEGHGVIDHSIAQLSLTQFNEFLTFLETKIHTKLLYYSSCYAAGVNAELLYKDSRKSITKTYPFIIITGALTDAPTEAVEPDLYIDQEKLKIKSRGIFNHFMQKATYSDVIDYRELVAPFLEEVKSFKTPVIGQSGLESLPQIRFPGLPWFSVLDTDKVISIGSILAKTRTEPLTIATFFKNKREVQPLGLLLYADDIPFELTITTKNMPAIISMIPGSALHHIKKISSATHTIDDMINSFLTLHNIAPRKIFLIDELTGPFSKQMEKALKKTSGTVQNIVIDEHNTTIYFTYNNTVYDATSRQITPADKRNQKKYVDFISIYGTKKTATKKSLFDTQKSLLLFTQPMKAEMAEEELMDLLDMMPDDTMVRIPEITDDGSKNTDRWLELPDTLQRYSTLSNTHKIVWIDKIQFKNSFIVYKDIIIDSTSYGNRVLFKDVKGRPTSIHRGLWTTLTDDYVPIYDKMLKGFQQHKTLDETLEKNIETIEKKSLHQLLTPEAVAKIKAAQEEKIKKQQ